MNVSLKAHLNSRNMTYVPLSNLKAVRGLRKVLAMPFQQTLRKCHQILVWPEGPRFELEVEVIPRRNVFHSDGRDEN